jgi:hypothetical protein
MGYKENMKAEKMAPSEFAEKVFLGYIIFI